MKHLSKEQNIQRDEIVIQLRKIEEEMTNALNKAVAEIEGLNAIIAQYNEKLGEAETWREEITSDMQSYIDERSDKWQEGEAGSEYSEWLDTFVELSFDAVEEVIIPDLPEFVLAQQIEDLPDQPG